MSGPSILRAKSQKRAYLLDIHRTFASATDLPVLLQELVQVAAELTCSEAASVVLLDVRSGRVCYESGHTVNKGLMSDTAVGEDVISSVLATRQPLVIHSAALDARVRPDLDSSLGLQRRSILAIPLLAREKPVGVLEVANRVGQGHYTEDDLEILEGLAALASPCIDNFRLRQDLNRAQGEMQRLDHMKSDFVAIASHELRTPLGLILGHATYLKSILRGEQQEHIDAVIRAAGRLKDLTEDMASIAHRDDGQSTVRRAPFSMAKLITEITGRFQAQAQERHLSLATEIPDDDPLLLVGDREKIDVALVNLVRNALTFTDEGGRVGIKGEGDGKWVKVFVADSGIGIPEGEEELVFERFYQVESHLTRKHGGMGLGLAIAKAMIELHGGQIACESKEGVGSLFWFMVPVEPLD